MFGQKSGYDIFLGGTTNESTWREKFIDVLIKSNTKLKYFNPVVENWTPECIELENFVKFHAKYHVYVITPKMQGVYSIAEMVESAHKSDKKTFFYIQDTDVDSDGNELHWEPHMKNSLNAVSNLLISHGAHKTISIEDMVAKIIDDFNNTPVNRSTSYSFEHHKI